MDINHCELFTPTDADILLIIRHTPEMLGNNYYIERRYAKIIKKLHKMTIINDNRLINNIAVC